MGMDKFFTPVDVADLLGVSPSTVRGWIRAGDLRAADIGTKRPRFVIEKRPVREFLESRQPEKPLKKEPKVRYSIQRY